MTVDEILASGTYTDRRGRYWENITHWGIESWQTGPYGKPDIRPDEMRLLIERDMHRDECPGMNECRYHPRPHILLDREDTGKFLVFEPNRLVIRWIFDTHAEAMDAAYKMAVSSD